MTVFGEKLRAQAENYMHAILQKEKRSTALEAQLDFTAKVRDYVDYVETNKIGNQEDRGGVSAKEVADLLLKLRYAFPSFFSQIKDDGVGKMIEVWHFYLKRYQKNVLNDVLFEMMTNPLEGRRTPNLPDIVSLCEQFKYNEKYRRKNDDSTD